MKQILLFSLLFLGNLMTAQKKYDQFYVNHRNDTIQCEIINFSNKRVNVIANGVKMSLSPKLIKSFSSYNSNGYRNFTILKNDLKNFYEVNIIGKISFYKVYTSNGYNGILPVMVKNDKIIYLNVLNPRKRIEELISDCPSLLKEWNETENYKTSDKEKIVNAYNSDCE
jgi:glycosyltransferase involved in cell wall biosynthesis